jgi:hypothetical protein
MSAPSHLQPVSVCYDLSYALFSSIRELTAVILTDYSKKVAISELRVMNVIEMKLAGRANYICISAHEVSLSQVFSSN